MGDSAYASMPGGLRRPSKPMAQDAVQFCSDQMWSPTMSAISQGSHIDANGFMLPGSDAASITGNFDGLELSNQRPMWTANGSSATTPVSLDFAQTVSPIIQRRSLYAAGVVPFQTQHGSGPIQDHGHSGIPGEFAAKPQSPNVSRSRVAPSRAVSRAGGSGTASGSVAPSYGPSPMNGHALTSYGGVPMLRQTSSHAPSHAYLDGSAMISPVSSVLTADLSALTPGYHPQMADEWKDFVNMDDNEEELTDEVVRTGSAVDVKLEESGPTKRRASADDETARSHPLYQRSPGADGYYHCPFAKTEECDHTPVKLKCNYDKYIDSHLRPFRCKVSGCEDVPFSSTACLLRHQREAHAMHGHGHRPNLCLWPDCERSKPDHGFPRRYNLLDHMKRVHGHNGGSEDAPPAAPARRAASQGRVKGSRVEKPARRLTRADIEAQARAKKASETRALKQQFAERRQAMVVLLNGMTGLEDQRAAEQLREGLEAIEILQQRLAELG